MEISPDPKDIQNSYSPGDLKSPGKLSKRKVSYPLLLIR